MNGSSFIEGANQAGFPLVESLYYESLVKPIPYSRFFKEILTVANRADPQPPSEGALRSDFFKLIKNGQLIISGLCFEGVWRPDSKSRFKVHVRGCYETPLPLPPYPLSHRPSAMTSMTDLFGITCSSPEDMAAATGLTTRHLKNVERGKIKHPRLKTINKIRSAYGLEIGDIQASFTGSHQSREGDLVPVRELRTRSGLSQEALAEKCHIAINIIRTFERGGLPTRLNSALVKLARGLGVKVSYLRRCVLHFEKHAAKTVSSSSTSLLSSPNITQKESP